MAKVLFTIDIPEPKVRKRGAPPSRAHGDGKKYSRKCKHKGRDKEASGSDTGGFFRMPTPLPLRLCGDRSLWRS